MAETLPDRLSPDASLKDLEAIVMANLTGALLAMRALAEIKWRRLYLDDQHTSFQEYAWARFHISLSTANRWVAVAAEMKVAELENRDARPPSQREALRARAERAEEAIEAETRDIPDPPDFYDYQGDRMGNMLNRVGQAVARAQDVGQSSPEWTRTAWAEFYGQLCEWDPATVAQVASEDEARTVYRWVRSIQDTRRGEPPTTDPFEPEPDRPARKPCKQHPPLAVIGDYCIQCEQTIK